MIFDDETLGAYVDGELDAATTAVIETAARTDAVLAARIDKARQLRTMLSGAFASVVAEPPPERLIKVVGGAPAGAKILAFKARPEPPKPAAPPARWTKPVWGAMAACLVAGLTLGVMAPWKPPADTALTPGGLVIAALDRQASGPTNGPVHIGLSFKAKDGAYCRTFSAGSTAGLACHARGTWAVRAAAPAGAASDTAYRTAGNETPAAVLDAVDAMIDGAPLDAQAEAKARSRGWR